MNKDLSKKIRLELATYKDNMISEKDFIDQIISLVTKANKEAVIEAVSKCDFSWKEGGYLRGKETCIQLDDAIDAITETLKVK